MSVPAIAAITLKYSAPEASPSPEEEVVLKDPVTKDHTETDMRCNRCGTPVQATTGIPVCAEQERVIFLSQLDKLRSWKRDGYADTFDVLEGLDHEDWHLRTGHGKNATAALVPMLPEADRKRLEEVEIGRRTLLFLIERGAGTLAEGFEALKLVAPSLRAQPPVSRFIVPASVMDMLLSQGIDAPPLADLRKRPHLRHEAGGGESARATRAKIGPNQQCPCGSGKKFKKCCRDAAG
ncbi:MAG: SEC-C domain-containing protein [Candidatus Wallbacteria bacterium]|nr:SEC-C domain-containing protein [Candidatus Wallbacteria bacterium]